MDMASIQTNTHSINQIPMHITPDTLWVSFSIQITFTLHSMPPTLSFCAKPKAKSQNPQTWMNSNPPGEVWLLITIGEGKLLSIPAHLPCRKPSPQGKGFPLLFENVDSATPGKPCVQNDMRVRWQEGRRKQFFKCKATNGTKGTSCIKCTAFILFQIHESIKKKSHSSRTFRT